MKPGERMNPTFIYPLCFECGLCCNGVIFARVELNPDDRRAGTALLNLVESAGIAHSAPEAGANVAKKSRRSPVVRQKFPQPCVAFDGCRCRIYEDRPRYCREFECLLLREVNAGKMERSAALRVIRTARQRADRVKRLFIELGDDDEHVPLSLRFRRLKKRMESHPPDDDSLAEIFSRLTLAVHDLNLLLREAFYR